jgi:hypothetical protein
MGRIHICRVATLVSAVRVTVGTVPHLFADVVQVVSVSIFHFNPLDIVELGPQCQQAGIQLINIDKLVVTLINAGCFALTQSITAITRGFISVVTIFTSLGLAIPAAWCDGVMNTAGRRFAAGSRAIITIILALHRIAGLALTIAASITLGTGVVIVTRHSIIIKHTSELRVARIIRTQVFVRTLQSQGACDTATVFAVVTDGAHTVIRAIPADRSVDTTGDYVARVNSAGVAVITGENAGGNTGTAATGVSQSTGIAIVAGFFVGDKKAPGNSIA